VRSAVTELLNCHPESLGDLLAANDPTMLPQLTATDRRRITQVSYIYTIERQTAAARVLNQPVHVEEPDADKASPYSPAQRAALERVTSAVLRAYVRLSPDQPRHTQTLENVMEHLARLYYLDFDLRGDGFDLVEFRDYLRTMPSDQREGFLRKYYDERYF